MHSQWHEILRSGEGKQEPSSMCLMSKQKRGEIISMTVMGEEEHTPLRRTFGKLNTRVLSTTQH